MHRRGQPMFHATTYKKRCNRPSSTLGGSRRGTISQLFGPMRRFQIIRRISKNPASMADVNDDGERQRFTRCRVLYGAAQILPISPTCFYVGSGLHPRVRSTTRLHALAFVSQLRTAAWCRPLPRCILDVRTGGGKVQIPRRWK